MQDSQDRAPDALDRLYAEARAQVDRLRAAGMTGPPQFDTTIGALRTVEAFMTEHGLDAYSIQVRDGYPSFEVEVRPPGDELGPVVQWAAALGAESVAVTWRPKHKMGGFDYGGYTEVELQQEALGARWRLIQTPKSIPHLDVPTTGTHTFPVSALVPPTRVDAAAEVELGERAAKALAGSAVA